MNSTGWSIVGIGSATIMAIVLMSQSPSTPVASASDIANQTVAVDSAPQTCSRDTEKAERDDIGSLLADHYATNAPLGMNAFDAGNAMMSAEFDCARDAQSGADQAHHYVLAATGELFMTRAPIDASVKRMHLQGVIVSVNKALGHSDISAEDRKLANDLKERAASLE